MFDDNDDIKDKLFKYLVNYSSRTGIDVGDVENALDFDHNFFMSINRK